jgi:hypothetical protein
MHDFNGRVGTKIANKSFTLAVKAFQTIGAVLKGIIKGPYQLINHFKCFLF